MADSKKRCTIKDVAKKAGVAVSTVSLALNNKKNVSEKTRTRVLEAAEELGFVMNASAQSLKLSRSRIIGIILPEINNIYYTDLVTAVNKYVEKHSCSLSICITNDIMEKEEKCIEELVSRNVDGIIIVPMLIYNDDPSRFKILEDYKIPYVLLSAVYKNASVACVMCDLTAGMYSMTKYLLAQGLKQIALIVGDRRVDKEYIAGYKKAFEEKGLDFADCMIFESKFNFDAVVSLTHKILAEKPEAIMTISDLMACAVTQAVKEKGLSVPEDISVTGFDDVLYSYINQTPITTVHQPIDDMCSRAVEILFDMIYTEEAVFKKSIELFEPYIVCRDSTL